MNGICHCDLRTNTVHDASGWSLHSITVLPLTIVYFLSEVHCTLNILHSITS